MDGVLIVNKPKGKTSFDMISEVRKKYNTKKVGHIGTLDPLATGVLPILIGNATKLSEYLIEHDKEYIACLKLGEKRDTGDLEGKIIETKIVPDNLSEADVNNALNSFLGETTQIPPMYSAIKVNGKKLYEYARLGEVVERKPRTIVIDKIELLELNGDEITFKVNCSKGTYIRVLCEDIAEKLNTVGYMKSLCRTKVGSFYIEDEGKLIELKDLLDVPNIEVNEYEKLINGMKLKVCKDNYNGLCNLYYKNKFIGIGEINNNLLKRKIII